jgi:hypothetical protein
MWPFTKKRQPVVVEQQPSVAEEVPAKAEESVMAKGFIGILEAIGKGFEKGLGWAVTYAVPVERLVALLFPAAAPVAAEVADATTLIQNAVLLVEQKYAASGVQSGTGAKKTAEVLVLTEQAVTGLLAKAGIQADTAYIQSIITAVVSILNVQRAPQAALPAAA